MLAVLLALVAGAASIWNFGTYGNGLFQIIFTILALLSVILYQGRRSRKNYNHNGTRIFTLPFAICVISLVGSVAVLYAVISAGAFVGN